MFKFLRRLWEGFFNLFRKKTLYLDDSLSLSSDTLDGERLLEDDRLLELGYFVGEEPEI